VVVPERDGSGICHYLLFRTLDRTEHESTGVLMKQRDVSDSSGSVECVCSMASTVSAKSVGESPSVVLRRRVISVRLEYKGRIS